jgi:hypothetical protein
VLGFVVGRREGSIELGGELGETEGTVVEGAADGDAVGALVGVAVLGTAEGCGDGAVGLYVGVTLGATDPRMHFTVATEEPHVDDVQLAEPPHP